MMNMHPMQFNGSARAIKIALMLLFISLFTGTLMAQENSKIDTLKTSDLKYLVPEKASLGIGGGLDYGGIVGAKLTYYPIKHLGLFGGLGYNLKYVGANAGLKLRFLPKIEENRVDPWLTAMYGYNTVFKIIGTDNYDKSFNNFSFGGGVDFHFNLDGPACMSVGILVPLRDSEVFDYQEELINDPRVEIKQELLPVLITVGINFRL